MYTLKMLLVIAWFILATIMVITNEWEYKQLGLVDHYYSSDPKLIAVCEHRPRLVRFTDSIIGGRCETLLEVNGIR